MGIFKSFGSLALLIGSFVAAADLAPYARAESKGRGGVVAESGALGHESPLAFYLAFDHHSPKDRDFFYSLYQIDKEEAVLQTDVQRLAKVVSAAYEARCHTLSSEEGSEECRDLIQVLSDPAPAVVTDFGKRVAEILLTGNFHSEEGEALARALSLDFDSRQKAAEFFSRPSGSYNTDLLAWFRYYCHVRRLEPLQFSTDLGSLYTQKAVHLINQEIEASADALRLGYKLYALGEIQYPEFFKIYRRFFKAQQIRAATGQALTEISSYRSVWNRLAMFYVGLFQLSKEELENGALKILNRIFWIDQWVNAPKRVIHNWLMVKAGRQDVGEFDRDIAGLYRQESAGMLSHWQMTRKGQAALLVLYEAGFKNIPLTQQESRRIEVAAHDLRVASKWENLSLTQVINQVRNESLQKRNEAKKAVKVPANRVLPW